MHRSHLPSCGLCRDAVESHEIVDSSGDYKPSCQTDVLKSDRMDTGR